MLGTNPRGKAIIVTTFSSHIARLKSIIEFGTKMNRKIVFLGRSLSKYVGAAETIGLVHFSKQAKIVRFSSKVKKELKKIQHKKEQYLLVVTGHQAEPKSVLTKIVNGALPFKFDPGDYVIFSCGIIPAPVNVANRDVMENNLKKMGVRIFRDIHVSGHAAREDHRDLISLLRPKHIIPAHGGPEMVTPMAELAEEMGYKLNETVHIMNNGARLVLAPR
jgi:ribonuclease J